MDVTAEMRTIILDVINYVQKDAQTETLKNIARTTQNLLFIFDNEKAAAYKMAIICEYLEDIAVILQRSSINALRQYLLSLKPIAQQQEACSGIQKMLGDFVDLQTLNPQLVVFWLQCPCDAQSLKRMGAFMLFLSKEQQNLVLLQDKSLLEDPLIQKLISAP